MSRTTLTANVILGLCLGVSAFIACGRQSSKAADEPPKPAAEPALEASESSGGPAARPAAPAAAVEAPLPAAPLDPAPLVAALGNPDFVLAKVEGEGVVWAVTKEADDDGEETGVARVFCLTKSGLSKRALYLPDPGSPPGIGTPPSDTVEGVHLELLDLDGDRVQEAVLVVDYVRYWNWMPPELEGVECEHGCYLSATEEIAVLYAITTDARIALSHGVGYETSYSAAEEIDTYPDPEKISYAHTVIPGQPAVVELKRTAFELSKDRPNVVMNPATHELFRTRAGARLEI